MRTDPINDVKAEVAHLEDENHRQKLLTLASTNRHVILSYPADMSDGELLEFIGYLTHEFRRQLPPTFRIGPHGSVKPT